MVVAWWCCMVTGQSVVLYSRLHIVLRNRTQLRLVLGLIVANAVVCHVPVAVLASGANSHNPEPFVVPYSVYEKVQVTLFFLQECAFSGLYIKATLELMRVRARPRRRGAMGKAGTSETRRLMAHMILVNVIVVLLDITILGLDYANLYDLQTSYKGVVYGVKHKLEFSILNRLVEMTQRASSSSSSSSAAHDGSNIRTRTDAAGIQMDGLEKKERRRRTTMAAAGHGGLGNNVYVRSESGAGGVAHDMKYLDAAVVMTTEVTIHRGRPTVGL
ncbi:uncharacterized protein B0T15DRAFT_543780 [Chaetomium strumarium]|uniref:DUF7703 domain-containing protein n=1 Tax=Chaetomium strumarium TaxID=1170767 RepID=A0AAJ0GMM4_9PEZI|nr:hypothetical protein B0T15DRAFT_543780 [Chaetomium strumarium]